MNILKLIAQLALDGTRFKAGIKEAEVAVKRFDKNAGNAIKGQLAGLFGAAAITAATRKLIEYGSAVHDSSKRTQQSTDALQEELYWLEQNGASLTDLERAYKMLAKSRSDALGGDADKLSAFDALGVNRAALEANTLSATFRQIAETIRAVDFGQGEEPLLERVLGKAAMSLIPAFRESLGDAATEAHKLGIVLREDVVNSLDQAGDEMDKMVARLRGPLASALAFTARQVRNTWDLLDIVVGGTGAWWYGLMTTGSVREAYNQAFAHGKEVIDNRISADAKRGVEDIVERERRNPPDFSSPDAEKLAREARDTTLQSKIETLPRAAISNLTAVGQLGGRMYVTDTRQRDTEVTLLKQQLEVEKQQAAALRELVNKSGRGTKFAP